MKEREEILNKMKNKYKLALFMVIRNFMVMPQGIKLGKTDKEINEMNYRFQKEHEKIRRELEYYKRLFFEVN